MADETTPTTTTYKVTDGPLTIRTAASGTALYNKLQTGDVITVKTDSRTEKGGYVWWEHDAGWSAERSIDGSSIFMTAVTEQSTSVLDQLDDGDDSKSTESATTESTTTETKYFEVTDGPLKVRTSPTGTALSRQLTTGERISVDPTSTTETNGYIWWKHDAGWSAERSVDNRDVFMKEVSSLKVETTDTEAMQEETQTAREKVVLPELSGTVAFQVAQDVKVRNKPSTDPQGWIIKTLSRGTSINCNTDTVTEADGYYWLEHDQNGWSAWQDVYGETVFMAEPGSIPGLVYIGPDGPDVTGLPGYQSLITRLPVNLDDTDWWQYFGNNVFAYVNGKSYNYDGYSQGLHGGLDFGNSARSGIPVYAGLEATYIKTIVSPPNNKVILESGDFTIIYQHVINMAGFSSGQTLSPDTQIAQIHHSSQGGWNHLHFEIRYMNEAWIVNPLALMAPELVKQIVTKFDPTKANVDWTKTNSVYNFFYKDDVWDKWITPLDQPVIKRAGSVIGPRA